jgi:hypothetical protein
MTPSGRESTSRSVFLFFSSSDLLDASHLLLSGLSSHVQAQSNEQKNTTAFLRDVEKWLQQKELRTLPTQRVNEHGLDGVLQGMEKVRVSPHLSSLISLSR